VRENGRLQQPNGHRHLVKTISLLSIPTSGQWGNNTNNRETAMHCILTIDGKQTSTADEVGSISDGYHTFNQLYQARVMLFLALMMSRKDLISGWSFKGADGSGDGEWCIGWIETPDGDLRYHFHKKHLTGGLMGLEKPTATRWNGSDENEKALNFLTR